MTVDQTRAAVDDFTVEMRRVIRAFARENRRIEHIELGHAQAERVIDLANVVFPIYDDMGNQIMVEYPVGAEARLYGVRIVHVENQSTMTVVETKN